MTQPAEPLYVDTVHSLEAALKSLKKCTAVGVDLEADSMFHFREKICLIQIAGPQRTFIVDPLALDDLSALRALFGNRRIKKVFHGADYDIRSLFRDFGMQVANLFDTEIACRFLGMAQTGLEKSVLLHFGARLDKKYQKKDWSQRPLPPEMVEYAAADACYLVPLAAILEKELKDRNRLSWVLEECRLLSRVRPPQERARPLFLNFKGAGKLNPRGLAVLEGLLALRLDIARRMDRPLFKVIGNQSLLTLAALKPDTRPALEKSRSLSRLQMERYADAVLETIRAALQLSADQLPQFPRAESQRFRASVARRVQALKTWKERRAAELAIDPSLILTKSQTAAIAKANPGRIKDLKALGLLKNWQLKEFGREVLGALLKK